VKITVKFIGEPRHVAGIDSIELDVSEGMKVSDVLEKLEQNCGRWATELVKSIRANRFLVLLDGKATLYLDGFDTPVHKVGIISIVHVFAGG